MTKTDARLTHDVEQELASDPKVNAAQIAVSVEHGAVSLLGTVNTFAEKFTAEGATRRVSGVRTVALDLTVKLLMDHVRADSDIAVATQNAFSWDVLVPNTVTAKVEHGRITLEGPVTWNYQREAAEQAVRHLTGVVGVFNSITIQPETTASQVKERVEAALRRRATKDANAIRVDACGGKVTLTGHASSWQSVEDAANAAWAAPGVTEVVDQVKVSNVSF